MQHSQSSKIFFSTSRSLPNAHKPPLQPQQQPNSSVCILGIGSGRDGVRDLKPPIWCQSLDPKGSLELGLFTDKLPRELLWLYRWKTFVKSLVVAIFWVETVHWKSSSYRATETFHTPPSPLYSLCSWWRYEYSTLIHCDWQKATGSVSLAKKGEDKTYPKLQIFLRILIFAVPVTGMLNSKLPWSNSFLQILKKPQKKTCSHIPNQLLILEGLLFLRTLALSNTGQKEN